MLSRLSAVPGVFFLLSEYDLAFLGAALCRCDALSPSDSLDLSRLRGRFFAAFDGMPSKGLKQATNDLIF